MERFSSLLSIPSARVLTSGYDQRSKAKLIESRSTLRNSGLICCTKVADSSGPGRTIVGSGSSSFSPEILDPGVASQTRHHLGTGIFIGGFDPGCEFSRARREPHSRYPTKAARNSGSAGSPASSADLQMRLTQRARCASVNALPRSVDPKLNYAPAFEDLLVIIFLCLPFPSMPCRAQRFPRIPKSAATGNEFARNCQG